MLGLALIIAFSALAGSSDTVGEIIGFRAGWGLGNSLFIATALATIVASARGSVAQAIILFEAALGVGIASGPLLGGALGSISWRGPFFGVAVLMTIALVATAVLFSGHATGSPAYVAGRPVPCAAAPQPAHGRAGGAAVQLRLLHAAGVHAFPVGHGRAGHLGLIFFGWGISLAFTSVFVAPWLQRRFWARCRA